MRRQNILFLSLLLIILLGVLSTVIIYFIIVELIRSITSGVLHLYILLLSIILGFTLVSMFIIYDIILGPIRHIRITSFEDLELIDIDSWEGQAIKIGWDFFFRIFQQEINLEKIKSEIIKRTSGSEERTRDGVYIIQDEDSENKKIRIYIGESSDFIRRMNEHKNKGLGEWAKYIYIFTSSKKNFGGTIRKKVEFKLIQAALRNDRLLVENKTTEFKEDIDYPNTLNVSDLFDNIIFILKYYDIKFKKEH